LSAIAATSNVRCCIVGGGPAGIMLGLQLARGGVDVLVLEKHADFLRDFRGDTVHPSTLRVLDSLGLMPRFERLPQRREMQLYARFADGMLAFADFSGLRPFPYLALVPQWDLLDLLADEGRKLPNVAIRSCAATRCCRCAISARRWTCSGSGCRLRQAIRTSRMASPDAANSSS